MFLRRGERTAAFIDGPNIYSSSRNLGFEVDYKLLREYFEQRCDLVRMYYFAAFVQDEEEYTPLRPLMDFLCYNGYTTVTKPAKSFVDAATGHRRIKGNMDIEMAVAVMDMAPRLDHVVLFTGDSDFRSLVESVQKSGARVTAVSTQRTSPSMVGDELRRQVDKFVDLTELKDTIERHRPAGYVRRNTVGSDSNHEPDDMDHETFELKDATPAQPFGPM